MTFERAKGCNLALATWLFLYRKVMRFVLIFFAGQLLAVVDLWCEEPDFSKAETFPEPALFQAIFLKHGLSASYLYAPWGNAEEENATLQPVRFSSGSLSRKFAYYGKSPIRFYQDRAVNESSFSIDSNESRSELVMVFQYSFTPPLNSSLERILVLSGESTQALKIRDLDFSISQVPAGTYQFHSFAREALYFKAGNQKFSLASGSKKLCRNLVGDDELSVRIEGFLARDGKYLPAYSQKIFGHQQKRGIFMLAVKDRRIQVVSLVDSVGSKKRILGLGTSPTTNPPPSINEEEKLVPESIIPVSDRP